MIGQEILVCVFITRKKPIFLKRKLSAEHVLSSQKKKANQNWNCEPLLDVNFFEREARFIPNDEME